MDDNTQASSVPDVSAIMPKLSDELWQELMPIGKTMSFEMGSVIYLQNAAIGGFFCVVSGRVKVSQIFDDGTEAVFSFYTRGHIFGEASALRDNSDRPIAMACTDVELLFLPKEQAVELMRTNPDFALFVMYSLSHKLSNVSNLFGAVAGMRVLSRLIQVLQALETYGITTDGDCWYIISHAELASLIGTTRSNVTVLLHRLAREGLIMLRRNQIKVPDKQKLCEYASVIIRTKPEDALPGG